MNIDENILQFSSDYLFILREKLKINLELSGNEVNMTEENNKKKIYVENEYLEFNGFSKMFFSIFIFKNIFLFRNIFFFN